MSKGYLIDTHALLWWFADDPILPAKIRQRLNKASAPIFVSAASAFEMAIKHRIGKLPNVAALLDDYADHLAGQGFLELPILATHALKAGNLPFDHRDPFDRLLIAQALMEDLTFVSNEKLFDMTGVTRIWS